MLDRPLNVLLIEDNPGDARLIQEILRDADGEFRLERVDTLGKGIGALTRASADVVLLDLSLPDSHGPETFDRLHRAFPFVPIVVLSGLADEEVAVAAVRSGAQDYLVKGQVEGNLIGRAIRYAVERQRLEDARRFLSEASAVLASSLDHDITLQRVAELAVPVLCDRCVIDLIDGGRAYVAAVAAPRPDQVAELRQLRVDFPVPLEDTRHPVSRVVASREPEVYHAISPELITQTTISEEHGRTVANLGIASTMVVPLIAPDRVIGAMTFVSVESGRIYEDADRDLAVDLAQRAALAIDNAQLYKQARDAIRVRDMVLSSVAHDLRAPLTPIKLVGETLRWEIEQGQELNRNAVLDGLTSIDVNVEKIASQIDELLDVARLQMGRQIRLQRRRADVVALVRGQVVDYQARTRRHRHCMSAAPDVVMAWVDVPRLERVVGNLLSNAIKYSPDGGQIDVRVYTAVDTAGDWAVVEVEDHGIGIASADVERLFGWYFRAERVAQEFPGTGIGLAGAAQIVRLHGGRITVDSVEGTGSTFKIFVPLGEPRYEEPSL